MLFDVGQAEQNIFLWNNTLFAVETKTSRTSKYWASYTPILWCLWRAVPRSSYPANSGKAKATGSQTRYTLAPHSGYLGSHRVPNDDICKLVSIVRQRQCRSSRYNGRRTHPFEGSHACTAQSLLQALCPDHHWDLSSYFRCVRGWRSWLDPWLPTRRSRVQAPAWSRVELSATFFRHTVRGQGR